MIALYPTPTHPSHVTNRSFLPPTSAIETFLTSVVKLWPWHQCNNAALRPCFFRCWDQKYMEMQGKDNDEVFVTDQKFEDHFEARHLFYFWWRMRVATSKNIKKHRPWSLGVSDCLAELIQKKTSLPMGCSKGERNNFSAKQNSKSTTLRFAWDGLNSIFTWQGPTL